MDVGIIKMNDLIKQLRINFDYNNINNRLKDLGSNLLERRINRFFFSMNYSNSKGSSLTLDKILFMLEQNNIPPLILETYDLD